MFELKNPSGTVHDFAHKMYWGHNIEEFGCEKFEFDSLETQKFSWVVFHFFPIKVGDFITRNMQSGKIGLYECVKSTKDSHIHDMYNCVFIFCGYYINGQKHIFNGYGVKTTIKSKISWFKKFFGG